MSTDAKSAPSPQCLASSARHRGPGIRIFMWPKVIFLYPTAIVALICRLGMSIIHDRTHDPTKPLKYGCRCEVFDARTTTLERSARHKSDKVERFRTPQNLLAMLFLAMFAFNLLVMALDFPAVLARRGDPRDPLRPVLHSLAGLVFSARFA